MGLKWIEMQLGCAWRNGHVTSIDFPSHVTQGGRTSEDITKITYSRRASRIDNKLVQVDNR